MGMERAIALLRGVNVGGKNRLKMADLARAFAAAGCRDVVTVLQSGNVIFSADAAVQATLAATVSATLREAHGLDVPVILRTAAALARALDANPFAREQRPEDALHVMFLADAPSSSAARSLDPERGGEDRFYLRGREVYLYCPHGLARTKLTNAYFDSALRTVSTVRNLRTLRKLAHTAT